MSRQLDATSPHVARALAEALHPREGRMALAARSYPGGEVHEFDAARVAPIGSVIKWPLRLAYELAVERGDIDPATSLTVGPARAAGGTGVLERLALPREIALRDAADLMIMVSDNLATNLVIDALGGLEPAKARLAELFGAELRLHGWARFEPKGDTGSMGEASAAGLLAFLDRLVSGGRAAEATLRAGERAQDRSMLARYLPHPNLSRDAPYLAHKSGLMPGVRADAGLIRSGGRGLALALLCEGVGGGGFDYEHEAERRIGRVAALLAHRHLGTPLAPAVLHEVA